MRAQETIFDEMQVTREESRQGLRNYLNTILTGNQTYRVPKYETTINQLATYFVRNIERAL